MKKRIFLSPPDMSGDEIKLIQEVFDSNYIAPVGPMLKRFEEDFCEYTGFKSACAVSSGTAAIHLALLLLGVKRDDFVISATLTFIGGVYPILYQGAIPRFIDCDSSFTMDPKILEEELEELKRINKLPKAVILTDLYGRCCDMKNLLSICERYNIPTITDACESLGSMVYNKHSGKGSTISAFSFNGNKLITTSGGGIIASDDKDLIERARNFSQQSIEPGYDYYEHKKIGFNYRMSNVLAAIGVGKLRHLDYKIRKKLQIFDYYKKELGESSGVSFMQESSYEKSTRWHTIIILNNKSPTELKAKLEKENIESRLVFKPMHLQPLFNENFVRSGIISEYFFNHGICLPCGTSMTNDDLERVCKVIKDFCQR